MTDSPIAYQGIIRDDGAAFFNFSEQFKDDLKIEIERVVIEAIIKQKQPGGLLHE